nr:hypothetical protein Iba_chr03bCG13450 [Ipomoea batatas]GMD61844.1 hypothetical protein Iba_chr12aCG24570 [Ipomoea batatas]
MWLTRIGHVRFLGCPPTWTPHLHPAWSIGHSHPGQNLLFIGREWMVTPFVPKPLDSKFRQARRKSFPGYVAGT